MHSLRLPSPFRFQMPSSPRQGARRAITLVELTLSIGLAAMVVFVAIKTYSMTQANSRYHTLLTTISQLRAAVEQSIQQGKTYAQLPNSIKPILPSSTFDANSIVNVAGVRIRVVNNSGAYGIILHDLAPDMCERIGQTDMGRSALFWVIDYKNEATTVGMDADYTYGSNFAAQATTYCVGSLITLGWAFK